MQRVDIVVDQENRRKSLLRRVLNLFFRLGYFAANMIAKNAE
jgi:hypothetical protein